MRPWNFASFILAALAVFVLAKWLRPHFGPRVGAFMELAAFFGCFIGIRAALRRITDGLDD